MLRVYLYGGPGTGKSTTAALVFGQLKQHGLNAELVTEYAKDLTWEKRFNALAYQPYMAGKQMWRMERLEGQVDVAVSDTSPLLSMIYGKDLHEGFCDWLSDDYRSHPTLNFMLMRDLERTYNPQGRNQTEEEARALDQAIRQMLWSRGFKFFEVGVASDSPAHIDSICSEIHKALDTGIAS